MQCPSCRAVYSNGLSSCPRCKTPASKPSPESETRIIINTGEGAPASAKADPAQAAEEEPSRAPATSTLIEFPGVSRAQRPQWRKELSERVREIQERRAREAEEVAQRPIEQPVVETSAPQLGLVPQPEVQEVNPIVAAALKRLERARQPVLPPQRPRTSVGRGAVVAAAARVAEEQFEAETAKPVIVQQVSAEPASVPLAKTEVAPQVKTLERERPLTVVQTTPKVETEAVRPQQRKVVTKKAEDVTAVTAVEEIPDQTPVEEFYDDRAPVTSRVAGSLIDLLVVA
ncbi:MAG: hypothetical protein M3362_08880, partial [Acidobacteriota bacterium]|nr:hypothetical protein [Acidobacteriota bacterium]